MATKQGISTTKGFQKKVPQAELVNGLEIKQDENGVLKIGDIIIPQKKLLWSGTHNLNTDGNLLVQGDFRGKTIEIAAQPQKSNIGGMRYGKAKLLNVTEGYSEVELICFTYASKGVSQGYVEQNSVICQATAESALFSTGFYSTVEKTSLRDIQIREIYEIIE